METLRNAHRWDLPVGASPECSLNRIMPEPDRQHPLPLEIDVHAAQAILQSAEPACLLDVREPAEVQYCRISGSLHIPMMQLPMRMRNLPRDEPILVLCHHGYRSLRAAEFLRSYGWVNAQSIRGGINAWSIEIDPSVPRY